ncbi:MAG: hypothetical protein ACOC95_09045 [Planctomycetota bacterium]
MQRILALAIVGLTTALVVTGCQDDEEQPADQRPPSAASDAGTYYERLSLGTPREAVREFVDAYRKNDYLRAHLVLAPEAQDRWMRSWVMLSFDPWLREGFRFALPESPEHGLGTSWYAFAYVMGRAKRQGSLLLDFTSVTDVGSTSRVGTEAGTSLIDVRAGVSDGGEMIFRTVQAPSGRWRILCVWMERDDQPPLVWGPSETVLKRDAPAEFINPDAQAQFIVGGKDFVEQSILAEVMATLIEENTGFAEHQVRGTPPQWFGVCCILLCSPVC